MAVRTLGLENTGNNYYTFISFLCSGDNGRGGGDGSGFTDSDFKTDGV